MRKNILESEDEARELLKNMVVDANIIDVRIEGIYFGNIGRQFSIDEIINSWKQKGYIKQSREEDIRERIEKIKNKEAAYNSMVLSNLKDELISILDNKIKDG